MLKGYNTHILLLKKALVNSNPRNGCLTNPGTNVLEFVESVILKTTTCDECLLSFGVV